MNSPTAASTYDSPVAVQWSTLCSTARCANGVDTCLGVK